MPGFKHLAALGLLLAYPGGIAWAMSDDLQQCLLDRLESAGDEVTVAELRSMCLEETKTDTGAAEQKPDQPRESVVDIRRQANEENRSRRFTITPYRANYLLYTYNDDPNEEPFLDDPDDSLENDELKFQVSFKMPLATELFGGSTDLLFAYTSVSWWQTFNDDLSNTFRETNYEPEIFFRTFTDDEIFGLNFINWQFGWNHQSNGQSEPESRGWDRAVGSTAIEFSEDLVMGLRAWYVIDSQDNNSDIEDYMGYGDIALGWAPNRNTFTMMYRPSSEGGAAQLTWSYPLTQYLRVYAEYWNGYGESLIDYDERTERFGLGVALNDVISRD